WLRNLPSLNTMRISRCSSCSLGNSLPLAFNSTMRHSPRSSSARSSPRVNAYSVRSPPPSPRTNATAAIARASPSNPRIRARMIPSAASLADALQGQDGLAGPPSREVARPLLLAHGDLQPVAVQLVDARCRNVVHPEVDLLRPSLGVDAVRAFLGLVPEAHHE